MLMLAFSSVQPHRAASMAVDVLFISPFSFFISEQHFCSLVALHAIYLCHTASKIKYLCVYQPHCMQMMLCFI